MRIRDGLHRLGNGTVNVYLVADGTDVTIISLDRLEGIEADWLLPGHGEPWTGGVVAAIERVRVRGASLAG